MINNDIIPLNYEIVNVSSADKEFPIKNIMNTDYSNNPGWSSLRFCTYPQNILVQFNPPSTIRQITVLIHQYKIPSKINIFYKSYSNLPSNYLEKQFEFVGYITPKQHTSNNRELKKVQFDNIQIANCYQLKLELLENYEDLQRNKFNQVSIISLEFFGTFYNGNLNGYYSNNNVYVHNEFPFEKLEHKDLYHFFFKDDEFHPLIKNYISNAKKIYYMDENEFANVYNDIQDLRKYGNNLLELEEDKRKFQKINNFSKVNEVQMKINELLDYVSQEFIMYTNENVNNFIYNRYVIPPQNIQNIPQQMMNTNYSGVEEESVKNKNETNNTNSNTNNNNTFSPLQSNTNNSNYYYNESSVDNQVSNDILQRHRNKQALIRQNLEDAQEIRRLEKMNNVNL